MFGERSYGLFFRKAAVGVERRVGPIDVASVCASVDVYRHDRDVELPREVGGPAKDVRRPTKEGTQYAFRSRVLVRQHADDLMPAQRSYHLLDGLWTDYSDTQLTPKAI